MPLAVCADPSPRPPGEMGSCERPQTSAEVCHTQRLVLAVPAIVGAALALGSLRQAGSEGERRGIRPCRATWNSGPRPNGIRKAPFRCPLCGDGTIGTGKQPSAGSPSGYNHPLSLGPRTSLHGPGEPGRVGRCITLPVL